MNKTLLKQSIGLSPKNKQKVNRDSKKISKGEKWNRWTNYGLASSEGSQKQIKCWESFEYFRKTVAKHETATHQKVWLDALITGQSSSCLREISGQDTLILSPRGSGKSSFLAEFVAYQVGMHSAPWIGISLRIIYLSYDLNTSRSKSRQIQSIILTSEYQNIFPWVRKSTSKWCESEWAINFEYCNLPVTNEQFTLSCGGLKSGINSRRSSLIIADDLYKNTEDSESDSIGKKLRDNWQKVVKYTKFKGARSICIGTRFSKKDLYNDLFTVEKGWKVIQQSAIIHDSNGNEKSYWEQQQPLSMLQKERDDDPIGFSFQRQNIIVKVSQQAISNELIIKDMMPKYFDELCLGVDLSASTKETADFTALVLCGRSEDIFYVIDAYEIRVLGNFEKLKIIQELYDLWQHLLPSVKRYNHETNEYIDTYPSNFNIWFDASAYGKSFEGDFNLYKAENNMYTWKATGISARSSKIERLRQHTFLFETGRIKFNILNNRRMIDGRKPIERLIEQLTMFGSVRHDDLMDALVLSISGLRKTNYKNLTTGNY